MSEKKIQFRFIGIDLISKAIAPRTPDFEGNFYSFEVTSDSGVQKENNTLIQFVTIVIRDGEKKQPVATVHTACIFEVQDFDENIILTEAKTYDVPKDLELFTKSAAISTVRGIVWSELRGTYLHNAVMPMIDVATLAPINKEVPAN